MRKLKEVLRLQSLGLSQHQIARSCSISQSTVHEYLSAAEAAGVKWPLPEGWDDQQIERALFPQRPAPAVWRKHPEPDWAQIHQELQTHKDLTVQLIWQEQRESNPDGYGFTAYFATAAQLFRELELARADGSYAKRLRALGQVDVLIVDDWAMAPLAEAERRSFLEICDERYLTKSTLLTSQLPVAKWHGQIGDPTLADSILDRLVHGAHRLELQGESMRKKRGARSGKDGE